ncbi:MAG: YdcF family protein [Thermoanaerobaculia bacterium]
MQSYGKPLTDPFLILVVVLAITTLYARHRIRKDKRARLALTIAVAATVAVAVIGTDAAVRLLERTLTVETEIGIPAVIVVPSGGSKERSLGTESAERVVAAVDWWKQHRRAVLVMSGADTMPGGQSGLRTLRLMRELAILKGVPPQRVQLESRSRNTRQHPVEMLRLRGIDRSTRIGLVTSATHMRRTRREFRKHFDTVIGHPVIERHGPLDGRSFIPSSESLANATGMVHEWVGIAWYALQR